MVDKKEVFLVRFQLRFSEKEKDEKFVNRLNNELNDCNQNLNIYQNFKLPTSDLFGGRERRLNIVTKCTQKRRQIS